MLWCASRRPPRAHKLRNLSRRSSASWSSRCERSFISHRWKTMNTKIKKATRHTNQNEGLIFEKSSPAKRAFELPPLDVPAADPAKSLGSHHRRDGVKNFPEVSEIEVLRHFTRLSTWNYAIDLGMYPLGS